MSISVIFNNSSSIRTEYKWFLLTKNKIKVHIRVSTYTRQVEAYEIMVFTIVWYF